MGVAPSHVWDPHRPVPMPVLKKFIEVKGNSGIHIHYSFGCMKDIRTTLPTPYFHGMTARVFCFVPDTTKQVELLICEDGHEDEWYAGFNITNGYVYYKASEGYRGKKTAYTWSNAIVTAYYSVAVRMVEDHSFKLYFDDKEKFTANMDSISGKKWNLKFTVAKHVLWSLHYTDEIKTYFPQNGLGPSFWFPGTKLVVGTVIKFQGEVHRFNETDVIEANFGPPAMKLSYKSNAWFQGKTIGFIVKKTEQSFILMSDFGDEAAIRVTPSEEPYKSGEIKPEFSDSFRLLNVYVEWSTFVS
ncbi:uncharacterized protein [Dermacentor albipictus]|uniref:uncharacterized protein n=1 Tax=Dermacentor albipictus TaxID=60249 RepID=UPI0038FD1A5F